MKVRERVKHNYPTSYFSILSVIQGVALGILGTEIFETSIFEIHPVVGALGFLTVCLFIITWHEYFMGINALPFIPTLRDSFIPFSMGIAEILLITSIKTSEHLWFLFMGLFCFISYLAFINMFRRAKEEPENIVLLQRLESYKFKNTLNINLVKLSSLGTLINGFIFIALYFISLYYSLMIAITISFLILILYLARAHIYWHVVLDED